MGLSKEIAVESRQEYFEDAQIISSYTADEAINDGYLIDVSEMARETGFKWPVRITRSVHNLCTPPKSNQVQSYEGRLWDILLLAFIAVRHVKNKNDRMATYKVKIGRKLHTLWAVIDGTSGSAIHIMLPEDY